MNVHAKPPVRSEQEVVEAFRLAAFDAGIALTGELIADGELHRYHIDGDRKGSRNGWAVLHLDGHRPAGAFGSWKDGTRFTWKDSANPVPMTPEERAEMKRRAEEKRAQKREAQEKRHSAAAAAAASVWGAAKPVEEHPYLQAKGVKAHGVRVGRWERVSRETGEVFFSRDDALLVPMRKHKQGIVSLQAIFPEKCLSDGTRNKDYFTDGAKEGVYCPIGQKPQEHGGRAVFIIAEGYATAASLHECTGHVALVAFDTSNLLPLAKAVRQQQPDAIILMAADNDQWSTSRESNPGVDSARVAADAVQGLVAVPPFEPSEGKQQDDGRTKGPTDFNDLHQLRGADAVRQVIADALAGSQALDAESEATEGELLNDQEAFGEDAHFAVLGFDRSHIFIYSHARRQVVTTTLSSLTKPAGLIELAPLQFWEMHFMKANGGVDCPAAANWVARVAEQRGVYDPSRIRGRGVWRDDDRFVCHHGNFLTVDGEPCELGRIQSRFCYEAASAMRPPANKGLTEAEGRRLAEIAGMFQWRDRAAPSLMAGWAFLSSICGALRWRPHVWVSGAPGSGKSTLLDDFLAQVVPSEWLLFAQGNSTEAGIRQTLALDARPVLIDEFETNTETDAKRIETVLTMIRQSSSDGGALVARGTTHGRAMNFAIRSMFCMASVGVSLSRDTDRDRITVLELASGNNPKWPTLQAALAELSHDRSLGQRMFARALGMLDTIEEAVRIFCSVTGQLLGRQRDGDQYGTLLAGAWCLQNDRVPAVEEVEALVKRLDLSAFGAGDAVEADDSSHALTAIMGAPVRLDNNSTKTVAQLIELAIEGPASPGTTDVMIRDAAQALGLAGIRVSDEVPRRVLFAASHTGMVKLIEKTPYASGLTNRLARLEGAEKSKRGQPREKVRFAGVASRYVAVPLHVCLPE